MNQLLMRIWLLPAIAFVLNACSSTAPTVKQDNARAYQTTAQPRTVPSQNYYKSAAHSGAFQKPGQRDNTIVNRFMTQPRTVPSQNYYRPAAHSGVIQKPGQRDNTIAYRTMTQPRTVSSQNYYRSATHSGVIQKPGQRDNTIAYRTMTQARMIPTQNFYSSATYSGVFEKPGELEQAVEFWRKTYVVWHRSEVAFHDNRYLDVVYEVMELPGYVDECLTSEQKEMVNQRRDFWEAQLAVLESKLRYNAPLNTYDRQLIAKLESGGRQLSSVLNGAAERVRSQRGTRERFKMGLYISRRYDRQFRKIFIDAGLPEDLAYLPHVESSFQPAARSSAGAVGMWQFTKAAAKTFMPGGRADQRLDPFASAIGAARYLSYAYSKLGDWPTAITSYNHGIGGMKRAQNQVGRDFCRIVKTYESPAFGFASRNYYAQFLAAREIASNPAKYFPEGVSPFEPSRYLAAE